MANRESKSSKKPLFFAIFFLTYFVIFPISIISLAAWPDSLLFKIIMPICFLVVATSVFMILNICVFTTDYSVLGTYRRRPLPDENPLLELRGFGMVGGLFITGPLVKWIVYPSGLGIIIFGIGKIFIPIENVIELKKEKFFPIWPPYQVLHNSPELNNPIILPKELFDALQELRGKHTKK